MEDDVSMPVPAHCANAQCRGSSIKPIHHSARQVAIDAVKGPPVFALLVTYRCSNCGHTWAVRGYSAEQDAQPPKVESVANWGVRTTSRGW